MGRPRRRKKNRGFLRMLRNAAIVSGARAFLAVVPLVPLSLLQLLGRALGNVASLVPGRRRRRLRDHLLIAYPSPEHTDRFRARLVAASYRALAQLFFEGIWAVGWKERDNERVEVAEAHRWEELRAYLESDANRGLILYTAHLGPFEIAGRWICAVSPRPVMVVAAKPKIPQVADMVRAVREKAGYRLVWRGDAGLATMRHLRAGGVLVMLVDHNLKGPGVAVPFFGREGHTLLAPARLALQSGARATTTFCLREGLGKFRIVFDEPLALSAYPRDPDERLRAEARLTAEYTQRIEERVRQHPEQYIWMHRRWQKRSDTVAVPE